MEHIYPQIWLSLPKETKEELIKVFGIQRTGVTEIVDQRVVSDGYTEKDLEVISLDKMNEYIGSHETFVRAWEITLAKIYSELHPPVGEIGDDGIATVIEEEKVLPINEHAIEYAKTKKNK